MILDTIVAKKKEEVAALRVNGIRLPQGYQDRSIAAPRGFRNALVSFSDVAIIAEAKKASPSQGVICADFDIESIVGHYEACGAQALSVLTDADFFQGGLVNILKAREKSSLPVLRKDFIIDELQIKEAATYGADAILLIAAILEKEQLQEFLNCAKELQMDVLVEVHDEAEVEKSLGVGCDLVGVNNRNLKDFSVDISTTFRLKRLVPDSIPLVSESGLRDKEDMQKLRQYGVTAALIGETLMRAGRDRQIFKDLQA